ncbi:MAG TPA: hypothetical protein VIE67_06225 [Rudaea sp.]|jgi:hypothetical protein|uniref:hypothetical protein n=1 Tax=Rudaea sp. TaxID=2136325 RepID=UPI002F91EA5B
MRGFCCAALGVVVVFGALCARPANAQAQDASSQTAASADDSPKRSAQGHGSVSIDFFDTDINGFWLRSNLKLPLGVVHMLGTGFDASYNVSNDWTIYGGVRYFDGRATGPAAFQNCPTITAAPQCAGAPPLTPQQPDSPFLDDGNYHGAWQDWNIGAAWHASIGGYDITPSATAYIPTHDYPTYGNAVVGQDLRQLLLAVTLSHQFDFTDFYYKLGYGYALSQHVLGINPGYQRFDGELGWFVTEKFSVRGFVTGRAGFGARAGLGKPNFDIFWYERQRTAQHDYHAAGLGFDYAFSNKYLVSASVQHEFWGDTVFDFKYAIEARLTRSF